MTTLLDIVRNADRLPTVSFVRNAHHPLAGSSALVLGVVTRDGEPRVVDPFELLGTADLDALDGALAALADEWSGTCVLTTAPASVAYPFVALVGLDDDDPAADAEVRLRRAAGVAARTAARIETLVFALPVHEAQQASAVVEGALLGGFVYPGLHARDAAPHRARTDLIHVVTPTGLGDEHDLVAAVEAARATLLTRTLVDLPPNLLYPESFARLADELANADGLDVQVWDAAALREQGFGGLTGVGQGSAHGPALVRIDYAPAELHRTHLAFVGKGITYDSGGINLKLSELDYMSFDMSGAAAALAAVLASARLRLPARVTAWLALAENVPSGTAQRPSDVVTMRDGTTVEIRDTDAEGRLVLADAIVAATAEHPDIVVDVATLTGAQQVALGNRVSALMANDDTLAGDLARIATAVDERVWRMPLTPDLAPGLRSRVADIANKAERPGGMLTAALFLEHFVSRAPSTPRWAHLDICGPAINRAEAYGFTPLGATGVMARTLLALARHAAG